MSPNAAERCDATALERRVDFLRRMAAAPPSELASFGRAADGLPHVLVSEAGDVAAMLANSSGALARQVHRATGDAQTHLRDCLAALAAALEAEWAAHGTPPHYLRD